EVLTGVNQMFDPSWTPSEDKSEAVRATAVSVTGTERTVQQLEDTFAEYLKEAQALAQDSKGERSFDAIFALDAKLDGLCDRAQALIFSAQPGADATARE